MRGIQENGDKICQQINSFVQPLLDKYIYQTSYNLNTA